VDDVYELRADGGWTYSELIQSFVAMYGGNHSLVSNSNDYAAVDGAVRLCGKAFGFSALTASFKLFCARRYLN
jgi:hypothetical protein